LDSAPLKVSKEANVNECLADSELGPLAINEIVSKKTIADAIFWRLLESEFVTAVLNMKNIEDIANFTLINV
jgi:hypothetical protein